MCSEQQLHRVHPHRREPCGMQQHVLEGMEGVEQPCDDDDDDDGDDSDGDDYDYY